MINHQKHKRNFYVTGMISLVLLPLMCLLYFYKNETFKEAKGMSLSLPNREDVLADIKSSDFRVLRNYKTYSFNKSIDFELVKLGNLQLACRKLKKENDTINGVKIHFGEHSDYATYIRILDIMVEEDIITYINYKNDLWVLIANKQKSIKDNPEKFDESEQNHCGTQAHNYSIWFDEQYQIEMEEKKQLQITFFKKMWPIFLAYLGIVFLNIFALVKFNKNRKFNQKTYI